MPAARAWRSVSIHFGDRQKGRIMGGSIVNCAPEAEDILRALHKCTDGAFRNRICCLPNPYGLGDTSQKITGTIKDFLYNNKINLKKVFYDIDH